MLFQLLPIISGILSSVYDASLKNIIRKNSDFSAPTYLFLTFIFLTLISAPLLLTHSSFPFGFLPWLWAVLAIASYVFTAYCFISALKIEDISNVAIVTKISFVLAFIFGFLFFNEEVTFYRISGVLLISLGIVIVFFEKKKFQLLSIKGLAFGLLNGVGFATAGVFSKHALTYFSPYSYIFLIYLGLTISFFFFPKVRTESKILFPRIKYFLPIVAFIGVLSYLTNLLSLKYFGLSFTYIIFGAVAAIFSVFIGIFLFKEYKNLPNKIIGLICVLVGILLYYK